MAVAGCDLLAPEALEFAKYLEEGDVKVEMNVYEGATHSVLVLAKIHEQGKMVVRDACQALGRALAVALDETEIEKALGLT
jgi:acetyl esterase/lipase